MSVNFSVQIWTSDKNMACLPATCFLFNNFWPTSQKVQILGYKKPNFELPDNFEFISLGVQRGPKFWSDDMKSYYSSISDDFFYSIWEDALILKPVDSGILKVASELTKKDKKFFKFNLTADVSRRPNDLLKEGKEYDLILARQNSLYRFSTQHCIWNTEVFLDKLEVNQSPWDFELSHKKSFNDGLNIYATRRKFAVYMGHLYRRGQKMKNWHLCSFGPDDAKVHNVMGLDKQYVDFLEEKEWVPEI
jgi:hypothetical protein